MGIDWPYVFQALQEKAPGSNYKAKEIWAMHQNVLVNSNHYVIIINITKLQINFYVLNLFTDSLADMSEVIAEWMGLNARMNKGV